MAASIRQKLANVAQKNGEDFQRVLTRYALERFAYRISRSSYADRLILKGAMLFLVGEIFKIGEVELAHEKELFGVSHNDWSNPGIFEFAVLLNNRNDPAVKFAELSVTFAHDFFTSGYVEKAGGFFKHNPLP